jgi:HEAT repeat protein
MNKLAHGLVWLACIVTGPVVPHCEAADDPPARARTLAECVADLGHVDAAKRRQAALDLGALRDAAAVGPLRHALDDAEPRVREAATWALGELGPDASQAVPALIKLCQEDVRIENRHLAVKSLGQIGPDAAAAVTLLRHVALGGRGERGEAPFQPAKSMQPLNQNVMLRTDAIRALGKIKDPKSLGLLLDYLHEGQKELASGEGVPYFLAACHALGDLGVKSDRVITALKRAARLPDQGDTSRKLREAADTALRKLEAAR